MISVMVVDDQRYERLGLALMLKGAEGIRIVAQAENGREAVDALAALAFPSTRSRRAWPRNARWRCTATSSPC